MLDTNKMKFTSEQLENLGKEIINALVFQWDFIIYEILNDEQRKQWYAERGKDNKVTKDEFWENTLKSELFLRGLTEASELILSKRFADPDDTLWGGENFVSYEK